MNQDQINAVVGAVVQAVVKTLVEQITPIVVEEVKKEIMAGAQGVLAMEPETLNKPILAVIMGDDAVRDEIVELIENSDPVHSMKKDVETLEEAGRNYERRLEELEKHQEEDIPIHSDEFKQAVRAIIKEAFQ